MKNDKKFIQGKKFGNDLIKQLYKIEGIISVTIVGSFTRTYDLDKIGDLDIVIISKKITGKLIKTSKKKIKNITSKYPILNKKLKINDTFGPVKYDATKYFTVHMMIYDIKGHIDHAINSPFTCYDWQRSNWLKGKKLKAIFPVENIYLRDFFEARRNSKDYLRDLKKNKISIRKYQISIKKVSLKKRYYKINTKNRGEFVFHIVNNLINNYNKFYTNKNIKISSKNFGKLFLKITKNDRPLWNKFKYLSKQKINLSTNYSNKSILLGEKFITYFNQFLRNESKKYKRLVFLRHAKTFVNDKTFLGQGRNPQILKIKLKPKLKEKYNFVYSSPLKRSISTAKLFSKKNPIISEYLSEINYGKAEGMSLYQYSKKFPEKVNLWKKSVDTKFPNGENTRNVKIRVSKFISEKIIKKLSKKNFSKALIVTHNVFLRCLIGHFLKIQLKNYFKINIAYLHKIDFILRKNKIYPDLKRKDFKKMLISLYD